MLEIYDTAPMSYYLSTYAITITAVAESLTKECTYQISDPCAAGGLGFQTTFSYDDVVYYHTGSVSEYDIG